MYLIWEQIVNFCFEVERYFFYSNACSKIQWNLRVLKKLSVIKKCPLLGGSSRSVSLLLKNFFLFISMKVL